MLSPLLVLPANRNASLAHSPLVVLLGFVPVAAFRHTKPTSVDICRQIRLDDNVL